MKRFLAVALIVLASVSANTCGGSKSPSPPTTPPSVTVASVVVSGWLQPVRVGDSVQLTATAISTDGSSRIVTGEATWETSNTGTATVVGGLVTARGDGFVSIIARFGGQSGRQDLTIEPGNIPSAGLACGVERWAVKTLSDPAASSVDLVRVVPTTIKALNEMPTHCSGLPNTRAFAEEFILYEVVGRITFVRLEDDRDYHVALADPADGSYSIVTEVTDTACVGAINSPHRDAIGSGRATFLSVLAGRSPSSLVGTTVRVRGVGFFDFNHGQIGRSRNCMELHPLTFVERISGS